jgi:hypothetical protein
VSKVNNGKNLIKLMPRKLPANAVVNVTITANK